MAKKRSLFERLAGSVPADQFDGFDDDFPTEVRTLRPEPASAAPVHDRALPEDDAAEGQLPVDMYQTPTEIVLRTFVAGVRPEDLSVSISRDMVVIEGSREERDTIIDSDYFNRELFWGAFTRTVLLPQEIDVDAAAASAKDGLLTLVLPKLDKARQTKLRVKAG